MDLLVSHIVEQFPTSHLGNNAVTLYPLWRAPFGANAYMYVLLPMLMAIAGVVLLLVCANVANLMLVKSVSRRREIAIRLSIGASRSRLIRQLLVESLVLSLAGGILAMFLTAWTTGTLAQIIPPTDIPVVLNIPVDRAVLFRHLRDFGHYRRHIRNPACSACFRYVAGIGSERRGGQRFSWTS